MASIMYDDIFSSFLGNIKDYDIASKDQTDAYEDMAEYLHKALSNMYIYNLFSEAVLDDELHLFTYEMKDPIAEAIDEDFVIKVLGKGMMEAWISPQVKSTLLTHQMFSGGDKKWFAQANQLNQMRELESDIRKEIRSTVMDRGWMYNTYIGTVQ